jgi:hypothetical protein
MPPSTSISPAVSVHVKEDGVGQSRVRGGHAGHSAERAGRRPGCPAGRRRRETRPIWLQSGAGCWAQLLRRRRAFQACPSKERSQVLSSSRSSLGGRLIAGSSGLVRRRRWTEAGRKAPKPLADPAFARQTTFGPRSALPGRATAHPAPTMADGMSGRAEVGDESGRCC